MTDETKFKLLAAFKRMGQRIDMSRFGSRLIFQKRVYFLQELGLRLGNTYGWYIRGPYSREAASDGFHLMPIQDDVQHPPKLTRDEYRSLGKLEKLISESKKRFKSEDEEYILELLASLHFLLKYGYPRPTNRKKALEKFLELKPQFKKDAETALRLIERNGLV